LFNWKIALLRISKLSSFGWLSPPTTFYIPDGVSLLTFVCTTDRRCDDDRWMYQSSCSTRRAREPCETWFPHGSSLEAAEVAACVLPPAFHPFSRQPRHGRFRCLDQAVDFARTGLQTPSSTFPGFGFGRTRRWAGKLDFDFLDRLYFDISSGRTVGRALN
jgi:hypothetical protein